MKAVFSTKPGNKYSPFKDIHTVNNIHNIHYITVHLKKARNRKVIQINADLTPKVFLSENKEMSI